MADDNIHTHELIDDYLLGKLEGKALDDFEKRLKKDKSFAKKVELHKLIIEGIIESEDQRIQDIMDQADEELAGPLKRKVLFLKNYRYAAFILVLLAIGAYFLFFNESKTERLFSEYFSPYKNDLITYTRGNKIPADFNELSQESYNKVVSGMKAYDNGQYKKAADLFGQVIEKYSSQPELIFYLSISQLEIDEPQKAVNNLFYLQNLPDFRYKYETVWYLALAYLKKGNKNEALIYLSKIPEQSKYTKQASEIKQILKP